MLSFGIHFATCHGTALVRAGPSTYQSHRCQAYRPAALRLYCVTLCNNDDCNIDTPSTVPPPLHTAPCHTHMATHAAQIPRSQSEQRSVHRSHGCAACARDQARSFWRRWPIR